MNNVATSRIAATSTRASLYALGSSPIIQLTFFFALHIPLALAMATYKEVATMHALATAALGLWWAASAARPDRVLYVAAYITGAEVLWRMTQAQIFWEFGKYALVTILLVTMLRAGRLRGVALPFLYFALLLPSTILPLINTSTEELRGNLSFNLSGPLSLMFCAWYFPQVVVAAPILYRALLLMVAPLVGIVSVALLNITTATSLRFTNESNFATSGGFGPNQVSAMLGLGVLALLLYLLLERSTLGFKALLFVLMIAFGVQSALTFSRTGLYSALFAGLAGALFVVRDSRARFQILGFAVLVFVIANYLVLPQLDDFTGGTLSTRFQNVSLTGRDAIIRADLQIWADNPVFGVGPGKATALRAASYRESAAHTEFSRLLAEHGLFGLASFLILLWMGWRNFRRARTPKAKALAAALSCWGFGFMLVGAMRIVAPAVILGMAGVTLMFEEDWSPQPQQDGASAANN